MVFTVSCFNVFTKCTPVADKQLKLWLFSTSMSMSVSQSMPVFMLLLVHICFYSMFMYHSPACRTIFDVS